MRPRDRSNAFAPAALLLLSVAAAAQAPPPEYNRSIADVSVTSSGFTGSFFDVTVELEVGRDQSLPTQLDLSTEALVLVNGTTVASAFSTILFDLPYDGCGPTSCQNQWDCASLNAGGVLVVGSCKSFVHPADNSLYCHCTGAVALPVPSVPATPGDVITVILRPAPGALPELPGFGDDDEEDVRVPLEGTRPFCAGDGSGGDCPCQNFAGSGEGCENSTSAGGELFATGSVEVGTDDLVFNAVNLPPNQPALLFYGTVWINGGDGAPFGDGLRCVGGQVVRIGVDAANASGEAEWGPGLAADEGWADGDNYAFQAWYRDPGGPCDTGFNLTNALDVVLEP